MFPNEITARTFMTDFKCVITIKTFMKKLPFESNSIYVVNRASASQMLLT